MIENEILTAKEGGVRLDAALLLAFPSSTKAFVKDAISIGDVIVNGRRAAKGLKLRGGERLEIRKLLEAVDNRVTPDLGALSVVFEDDAILALDKPAGMPVQPLSCRETGTLMNAVVARYPNCQGVGDSPLMAGALHRIDADTSGLVLVAKSQVAYENLRNQFSAQTVKKTYLALVEGSVAVGGTLEHNLVHDPTLPFCRMIDLENCRLSFAERQKLKPLHAVTRFEPVRHLTVESEERTLLEVTIFTGVTHQIRAQLALAGLHIINDRLYGAFAIENQTGHCLHALAASFRHPLSGDAMEIRTPYPNWAH